MDAVAGNYLRAGDLANAAQLYTSLEHMNAKYARMARCCRVLNDPVSVPIPHRHQDMCEALLEPTITPEILIGEEWSTDAVQKRYQRLVVHAHPDKNPHPKAANAFLRLGELRERAMVLVVEKQAERAAREAARQLPAGAAVGKSKRGANKTRPTSSTGPLPTDAAPKPAAGMPSLKELRNARITLSSLKRKELDDAALADALLNATQRHAHCDDIDGDDSEDDEDSVSVRLASTVPDMARHRLHAGPPAGPVGGKRPTSHHGKRLAPLKMMNTAPWTDAAPTGRDLLARRAGATSKKAPRRAPRQPTPPSQCLGTPPPLSDEDALVREVTEEGSAPIFTAPTSTAMGAAPMETAVDAVVEEPAAGTPLTERAASSEMVEGDVDDGESDSEDALAALRDQISSLISRVGTMKRNSGGIRLTADLSYATYEREKEAALGSSHPL